MKNSNQEFRDVVIVGSGISGSSTAIRLLQAGIRPLMVDKENFPRDTTGEGLSPAITGYLDELGLLDQFNQKPYVKKKSFQIVSPNGAKGYTRVDLEKPPYKNGIHSYPWGFNVHRLRFDMAFLERARELGAEVRLETKATKLLVNVKGAVTGVELQKKDGQAYSVRTPLVIDCSGRGSLVAKQLNLRGPLEHVFDGQWANFAVRCHFRDVNMQPLTEGNLHYDDATVNIFPGNDCWFWFIPINLEEKLISIGFVARSKIQRPFDGKKSKEENCRRLMNQHPVLKQVIEGAKMDPGVNTTARLGHMNTQMSGSGFMCVGDAAFFADPAWGTGVTISLQSSKVATETAIKALEEGDFSAECLGEYETRYRDMIRNPFNSIRAYNYYYNDSDYINFIVERLSENQADMDMLGAVLFDYASHENFQKWTLREFKAYVREYDRVPVMDRVSQLDFESGKFADGSDAMASQPKLATVC